MARLTWYLVHVIPGLFLLAACGAAAQPAAQAPSQSPEPTAPPQVTTAATPSRTAQVAPTVLPASPSAAPSAVPSDAIASIPESTTPEGYHILGLSDAPVTLTMYSDFL